MVKFATQQRALIIHHSPPCQILQQLSSLDTKSCERFGTEEGKYWNSGARKTRLEFISATIIDSAAVSLIVNWLTVDKTGKFYAPYPASCMAIHWT